MNGSGLTRDFALGAAARHRLLPQPPRRVSEPRRRRHPSLRHRRAAFSYARYGGQPLTSAAVCAPDAFVFGIPAR
ncbi:hypothetical protein KUTG_10018 [Kutzneria sp. 744]|nr:hypothetical protein KUTG_10018 [Kutzneria sp. 744]